MATTTTQPYILRVLTDTFKASAALATKYIAVDVDSDGKIAACADGAAGIGILLNSAAAANDQVEVLMLGICPVKANTTITAGDVLASAASTGKVAAAASGDRTIGLALETATAQNDEITAFICPGIGAQVN
jgi:hypothetical protein